MSAEQLVKGNQVNRGPLLSVFVLTLVFVAAYFVLRALPDAQCGFLHY